MVGYPVENVKRWGGSLMKGERHQCGCDLRRQRGRELIGYADHAIDGPYG